MAACTFNPFMTSNHKATSRGGLAANVVER